jgi:glycosyltransferase involved in cell wall biosynthesis
MRHTSTVAVIIPALNEADAIGLVIGDIPAWVDRVIVADNGSTDGTDHVARRAGAVVVREPERGYGAACLAGLRAATGYDIVVFLDGDRSDHAEDMADLVDPIARKDADFVLGSRVLGARERGSLTLQQQLGNWLATRLIQLMWRTGYTDLGPFRAIRRESLQRLGMADRNYGWTVEMQIRAAEAGLRMREVPARYRCRIGVSKVSGTIRGVIGAGSKILWVIGREALRSLTTPSPRMRS